MAEDYTYHAPHTELPTKTGTQLLHEELAALREQVVKLVHRVEALENPPRPQPVTVNVAYDWED